MLPLSLISFVFVAWLWEIYTLCSIYILTVYAVNPVPLSAFASSDLYFGLLLGTLSYGILRLYQGFCSVVGCLVVLCAWSSQLLLFCYAFAFGAGDFAGAIGVGRFPLGSMLFLSFLVGVVSIGSLLGVFHLRIKCSFLQVQNAMRWVLLEL